METLEQEQRLPAHACGECGKVFGNAWGLRVHTSKKHGPNRTVLRAKPRRKYAKRVVRQTNDAVIAVKDQHGVNWCPCCGMDMRAVRLAVKMTAKE